MTIRDLEFCKDPRLKKTIVLINCHAFSGGEVSVHPATLWSSEVRSLFWVPGGHWGVRTG